MLPPRGARIVVAPSYLSALGGERLLADVDGRCATFLDEGFDRLAALRVAYFRHGDACGQRVRVEADGAVGPADRHREDGSRKGLSRVMPDFQFQVSRRGSTSDRGEGQPR